MKNHWAVELVTMSYCNVDCAAAMLLASPLLLALTAGRASATSGASSGESSSSSESDNGSDAEPPAGVGNAREPPATEAARQGAAVAATEQSDRAAVSVPVGRPAEHSSGPAKEGRDGAADVAPSGGPAELSVVAAGEDSEAAATEASEGAPQARASGAVADASLLGAATVNLMHDQTDSLSAIFQVTYTYSYADHTVHQILLSTARRVALGQLASAIATTDQSERDSSLLGMLEQSLQRPLQGWS